MENRPSPYHAAKPRDRILYEVDRFTSLIACVTPVGLGRIRLGILINGKETSVQVPFERAEAFLAGVHRLISQSGVESEPDGSTQGDIVRGL